MEKKRIVSGSLKKGYKHDSEILSGGRMQNDISKQSEDICLEEKKIDDYLVDNYGIFKLTPRECGRLQGVTDEDIDKMLAVNSQTQCYKQFGNSITVSVLMAIFSQLNIKGVRLWNECSDSENRERALRGITHEN